MGTANLCTLYERVRAFTHSLTDTKLNLTNLELHEIPDDVAELLSKDNAGSRLTHLDLSHNTLSSIPATLLNSIPNLRILFCSSNVFKTLPDLRTVSSLFMVSFRSNLFSGELGVQQLPSTVGWLILTDNQITALPENFGTHLPRVRKLMLANNQLTTLPPLLAESGLNDNLELIRLSNNKFEQIPECLLHFSKLSWLGLGGNPCTASSIQSLSELDQSLRVDVNDYVLETLPSLGTGASGNVYLAMARGAYVHTKNTQSNIHSEEDDEKAVIDSTHKDAVAIKLFKGELTSDGHVLDEVQTAVALRNVEGLIPVHAYVGADNGAGAGLVMSLIRDMHSLGDPPSFASVTRDVYPGAKRFDTIEQARRFLLCISGVAKEIHALKHTHGDLYAHNILYSSSTNESYLTDMGAAFPYKDDRIELLEVRAFGCLIEEMCDQCDAYDTDKDVRDALLALAKECMGADLSARPRFSVVAERLSKF
ncbi:hypothetical protein SARC_13538 [Sphaeroforma arctica JP610]|uniref:Protein kinase domain-containing protein n=1 Tax=Sphaeroforma arctica JP610 TaxID=667725 RepID=A0A0L0FCU6_9EUKA|nr:hypothetical protein SARC_13538 [Sphaeroforma arctica JP610]KNC73903.1 hypothetical protein SARC_13538 [Sphaeroforma arctica JP610]|eukprot:XP_014147805.1 hypothetical protein SARC_13538 [Sphaeroforma arctica JP610]